MRITANNRSISILIIFGFIAHSTSAKAAGSESNVSDQHIRNIVKALLQEKDQKIAQLEARIKDLENKQPMLSSEVEPAKTVIEIPPTQQSIKNPLTASNAHLTVPPQSASEGATASNTQSSFVNKLGDLDDEIAEIKAELKEKGVGVRGFFDVNAKTDNATDETFSVGSVELDLEYAATDHFAASSALVLCGNSAGVDAAAPSAIFCGGSGPGGIGGGQAGIAVAFADYHLFDNSIPPRGRILENQGFHIQAGRFDLPYSTDYQNFANTDRVTVTAPITTSRMQFGGFNSDGVRSYGSWKILNYSVFWTDSVYAPDGSSVGGRLGLALGKNNYRSHKNNPEGIEAGVSYLADLDKHRDLRHAVYGADLSLGYGFLRIMNEFMFTHAYNDFEYTDASNITTNYGKPDELGYHTTLLADLETFIDYPLIAFIRYGRWEPKARTAQDFDGTLVSINNISALTVGLNYRFNDYLKLKFEYTDSLGTSTTERFFDKHLGIAQMVMSF